MAKYPWEDDPVVSGGNTQSAPWENDPVVDEKPKNSDLQLIDNAKKVVGRMADSVGSAVDSVRNSDSAATFKRGTGNLIRSVGEYGQALGEDPAGTSMATAAGLGNLIIDAPANIAEALANYTSGEKKQQLLDRANFLRQATNQDERNAAMREAGVGLSNARQQSIANDENANFANNLVRSGAEMEKNARAEISPEYQNFERNLENTHGVIDTTKLLWNNKGMTIPLLAEQVPANLAMLLPMGVAGGVMTKAAMKNGTAAANKAMIEAASTPSVRAAQMIGTEAEKLAANDVVQQAGKAAFDAELKRIQNPLINLGAGTEAATTVLQTGTGLRDKVMQADEKLLENDKDYVALRDQYGPDQARKAYAELLNAKYSVAAGMGTMIGTAATGGGKATADAIIAASGAKNLAAKEALKNVRKDVLEEIVQNPLEDLAQYAGESRFDPNATYDPGKSAVLGAMGALGMSGTMQGVGYARSRNAEVEPVRVGGMDITRMNDKLLASSLGIVADPERKAAIQAEIDRRNTAPVAEQPSPNQDALISAAGGEAQGVTQEARQAADQASLNPAIAAYDDLIGQQRQVRDANQQALLGDDEVVAGAVQPAENFANRFPPEPPRALTYHPTAGQMVVFPDGSTMLRSEYDQHVAKQEQARLDGMIQDNPLPRMMERAQELAAPYAAKQETVDDRTAKLREEVERLRAKNKPAVEQPAAPSQSVAQQTASPANSATVLAQNAENSVNSPALIALQQQYDAAKAAGDNATMRSIATQINAEKGIGTERIIADLKEQKKATANNQILAERKLQSDDEALKAARTIANAKERKQAVAVAKQNLESARQSLSEIKQQNRTLSERISAIKSAAKPKAEETASVAPPPATNVFSIGESQKSADPITVKNGIVHQGNYPLEDYETGEPVRVPEGATHAQIRKAMEAAGQVPKGYKFFGMQEEEQKPAEPKKPRIRITAIGDDRVSKYADDLRSMAGDAGWAEEGGKLLRDSNGNPSGRTSWIPRAEWFMAGMLGTPQAAKAAVEKAVAGEPMTAKEKRTVQGMMDWLDSVNSQQAEVEALESMGYDEIPKAEQNVVDTLGDLDIDNPSATLVKSDEAQAMRALGFSEDEIRAELKQRNTRQGNEAIASGSQVEAQGGVQERAETGAGESRGQSGAEEGLTLTGQTNAEAAAEFKRQQEEANQQDKEPPAKNVTADQVDLFNTQGGLFNSNREAPKAGGSTQTQASADRIEDFGEKIGGARKDVWTSFKDNLSEISDDEVINQPLSKIWPEPDYQKMIDGGADSWVVGFIHAARDEVPRKPGIPWKQKRWAEQVKMLRGLALDLLSGNQSVDKVKHAIAMKADAYGSGLGKLISRIELYQLVGHSKSLAGVSFAEHHYSLYKGRENVRMWLVEQDAKATAFSNWPKELATGETKEELLQNFKDKFASLDLGSTKKKDVQFDIYSRKGNGFWIGKKLGRNPVWVAGPFATVGEARAYRDANNAELVAKLEKNKEIPNERRDTNNPRVGEDMRNGQDVTPQMFGEAFGFKGVEFGNWVEQKKRQKDLNEAYDALMDMAAILGVPPKAISLNGELGLAFGARGSGGIGAVAAHYEPGKVVINLTKKEGAGSLGHEWWHALDNYFQRMRSKGEYATEALDVSLASRGSEFVANTAVRKEMIEAFGEVVKAIRMTALKARSSKLDAKRSKEYWTTGREMSARAFESFLISKLQDQNASNDYLANIVDDETWAAAEKLGFELEDSYPYPTAGEMPLIRGAFEKFFQTIEHEETDKGVRLYSESRSTLPKQKEAVREITSPESSEIAKLLGNELPEGGKAAIIADIRTLPSAAEATGERMSRKTAEAIRFIAQMFGRNVVFYEATHNVPEGMNMDGKTLYVNVDGDVDALAVAGHEFVHSLEHTDPAAYRAALDAVKALLEANPARAKAYAKYYGKPNMKGAALAKELLSDIGGNLWRDEAFFGDMFAEIQRQHPHKEARSIITRLRDAIVSFINKLVKATPKQGFALDKLDKSGNGFTREELESIRDRVVKMAAKAFIQEEKARASGAPMYQPGRAGEVRNSTNRLASDAEEITLEGIESKDDEDADREAERIFLSSFPKSVRTYSSSSLTARTARAASEQAWSELGNDPGRTRGVASVLGPFSGYVTKEVRTKGLDGKEMLLVQVYGNEQVDAGLDYAPALSMTIDEDGEFAIYGPPSGSKLYKDFAKRGWAEPTRDADGNIHETMDGGFWTKLTGSNRKQAIELLGDAHARALDWLGVNKLGIHWKRTTGATGNTDGREGAMRFSMPRQSQWYYSQLARQIESSPDRVFSTGKQTAAWLQSNAAKLGVKADEIQWTGVLDWLNLQGKNKVSKADVLAYLDANGVQVEEVEKGGARTIRQNGRIFEVVESDGSVFARLSREDEARAIAEQGTVPTKYSQYVLPGGENYRELLLTLPEKHTYPQTPVLTQVEQKRMAELGQKMMREGNLPSVEMAEWRKYKDQQNAYQQELDDLSAKGKNQKPFRSGHWDEDNILAHIRFNDRTDADGNKVLFIDEIQSDWGQKGKKEGFKVERQKNGLPFGFRVERYDDGTFEVYDRNRDSYEDIGQGAPRTEAEAVANALINLSLADEYQGVPSAPFVTDTKAWVALAVKRMIAHAVQNGYDKVAFVNGEQSADRYDLSKHVKEMEYIKRGDKYDIAFTDKNGEGHNPGEFSADELEGVVGKEVAQKIINGEGKSYRGHDGKTLEGLDLKVGGEGMKSFYDRIVPQVVNDVLKKVGGGRMELVNIDSPKGKPTQPGFTITPEMREKVAGGQPLFSPQRSIASASSLPQETRAQKAQRIGQDHFNRFSVLENWMKENGLQLSETAKVYLAEERFHGRTASRIEDFRNNKVIPLIEATHKAGFTLTQVAEFLEAQHTAEANAQARNIHHDQNATAAGLTDQEAAAYLAKAPAALKNIANQWQSITNDTRSLLLNSGIVDQDTINAWQGAYKHYVPLKGADKKVQGGTGQGLSTNGKQKRRLGHEKRDEWIIENILRDHERAILSAEKNLVGHHLLQFLFEANNEAIGTVGKPEKRAVLRPGQVVYEVLSNGSSVQVFTNKKDAQGFIHGQGKPGQYSIRESRDDPSVAYMAAPMLQPNEAQVYVKGQAIRVQLNDDLLARAYKNLGAEQLGTFLGAARKVNNYLSKVYTGYNPEFFFTNLIRDFTTGVINLSGEQGAKFSASVVKNYPAAFKNLLIYAKTGKASADIASYRANGGSTGAAYLNDLERVGKDAIRAYQDAAGVKETARTHGKKAAARVLFDKTIDKVAHYIEVANKAGENAMRLAAFNTALQQGLSVAQAASLAKNCTVNFNRKGELGSQMSALYLFANPNIQGTAALVKALTSSKHKWQARALTGGMMMLGFTMAQLLNLGGDDKKISENERDKNFVISIGDKIYKMPVPYGYGYFYALGSLASDISAGKIADVSKMALRVASSFAENFSPFGNPWAGDKADAKNIVQLMPVTPAKWVAQMAANRNSFGGVIYPDFGERDHRPDSQKMNRTTKGGVSAWLAETMNEISGGSKVKAGLADVSPESINFMTRNIVGGTWKFIGDTTMMMWNIVVHGVAPDIHEVPIVRKFVMEERINTTRARFYDAANEVKEATDALANAKKLRDPELYKSTFEENRELIAIGNTAQAFRKMATALRDQEDKVMADDSKTLAEKRMIVKGLEMRESEAYERFMTIYRKQKLKKAG